MDRENSESDLLKDWCEDQGVSEAYQYLHATGVTFSLLSHLTLQDINEILPPGAIKVSFRIRWQRWMEESNPASTGLSLTEHNPGILKRRQWEFFDFSEVLNTPQGKKLIETSKNLQHFEKRHRYALIEIIVDHAEEGKINLSCKLMEQISEDIEKVFPHEKKEIYFLPKSKDKKSYSGLLYSRYHNNKRKKAKVDKGKENENIRDQQSLNVADEVTLSQDDVTDEPINEDSVENPDSSDISANDFRHWNNTRQMRIEAISDNRDILLEWPILGHQNGYKLIDEDFKFIASTAKSIQVKWKPFFDKVVLFFEEHVKDRFCKSKFDDALGETDDDDRERALLLLLHAVLKPRGHIRMPQQKKGTKVKLVKPTIADAQSSMIIETVRPEDVDSHINEFKNKLEKSKRGFHPVIVYIKNGGYLVYITENIVYKTFTVQHAVDICFKGYYLFHFARYPIESGSVWFFIQKYFYEVTTDTDKLYIGQCIDLFNFCNNLQ
ncbi:uncharacterized protein LOC129805760 [Phlebotomus papatasi]|uniref:uncharacterized protein LOC129805760 n=1 Tax=Phlebotomus papatasi TaxID=29031 RepID=UPI0024835C30|nr:uncharacterized protein LOC129805760 [Phlebotomus papatasi]